MRKVREKTSQIIKHYTNVGNYQSLADLLRKLLNKKNESQQEEVSSKLKWGGPSGKEKLAVRTSFSVLAVNLQSIL